MRNRIHTLTATAEPASKVRRILATVTTAARSVINPAALFAGQSADVAAADATVADSLPSDTDIDSAAATYFTAVDQARAADRSKRAARKILDRLPAGQYGRWLVTRAASSRQTPDLEQIRATYKALGLGPVPMKDTAPSLRVEVLASDRDILDDDTAGVLEDLAGVDPDLDAMLDSARRLMTRPRGINSTQSVVAALAATDGSFLDLITSAVSRLADPATNPAIASLPAERIKAAQDWAASLARTVADDGQYAGEVSAALDTYADFRACPTPSASTPAASTTAAPAADLIAA
jgi:hypothetical protein